MNYKKTAYLLSIFLCLTMIAGCNQNESTETTTTTTTKTQATYVTYDEDDYYTEIDEENASFIDLSEQSEPLTITKAGTYVLSGTLENNYVSIEAGKEDVVRIVLQNATIHASGSAAMICTQAKKLIISLPADTINTISDGTGYTADETQEITAAVYAKDDMTINGSGSLIVNGNENDAITSKDTLKLMEGNYTITAVDDGVVGRDFLYIHDGTYEVETGGDGFKTTYDTDDTKGDMVIEAGNVHVTSENDGLQAENTLTIYDGSFQITSGGGSINSSSSDNAFQPGGFGMWNQNSTSASTDTASAKGLKAGNNMEIKGGSYELDTSDDALHSNGSLTISDGNFVILSGDDGIHADEDTTVDGGVIDIQKSYEGIEGANVILNGGDIQIIASDDGINAAGGNDESETNGRPQDTFSSGGDHCITIHGGTIQVDASGDGVDSNGSIVQDGGTLVIFGPSDSGNGALDYDTSYEINGGTLFAVGMSGMAQAPSSTSSQNSLMINLTTTQEAQSTLYLNDADGNTIVGIIPTKSYNSVVISSAQLKSGETYQVYTGGTGGTINDAGYIESQLQGGTLVEEVTLSSTITTIGNSGGMGGGMSQGGRGDMPQGDRGGHGPQDMPMEQPK